MYVEAEVYGGEVYIRTKEATYVWTEIIFNAWKNITSIFDVAYMVWVASI